MNDGVKVVAGAEVKNLQVGWIVNQWFSMDLGRKEIRERAKKMGCAHIMPALECQVEE